MFLAGKSEDSFVNIAELLKIYSKTTEARVLECEIVLLEVRLRVCFSCIRCWTITIEPFSLF